MNRRRFIALCLALTASAKSVYAQDGDDVIPGFDDAAAAGAPVLVHVTAPWCEVCQIQKPIVADLLSRHGFEGMKKFDVDYDTQKEVLARHRVTTQSTMIVFRGGQEVDRAVGQTDPAAIEALLRKAL
ncbi:thioredoxin family protein [Mesorhizobium delmotii]|uniref:Thioredoxin-like protein n=1 Tax=Mesorhizobium delmotii TaxID=1631247 RepID=A0A2P9ARI4_9HYPH|nr:thioredoxin family protein [Mesorhizobium delmotii]SJM33766.1 Thioredoxin-like protein [Mesorhizobium delmotii]